MRALISITISLLLTTTAWAKYTVETIATDLNSPWSIGFLPEGDYLVMLKIGELRRISPDGAQNIAIANAPQTYLAGQGGYFDVLVDPEFATNQTVYLSFAFGQKEANATRVVKAQLKDNALLDVTPIFTTNVTKDTSAHYGGRIAHLNDGTLLATTGDGFEYRDAAQDLTSQMGKVVRFNKDGSVPQDNPFAEQQSGQNRVYTAGHRNPQGLAIDPATNTVYLHEHGPQGGDEVNVLAGGANYGWPVATHGINYSGALVSPYKTLPGMVDAIHGWTPSIAPSGLAVYRGEQFAQWNGDLLVGALVNQEVRHLDIEDGKVIAETAVFPEINERVRDVRVGPNGAIFVLTDGPKGTLYRISNTAP